MGVGMSLRLKRTATVLHTLGAVGLMRAIAANLTMVVNASIAAVEPAAVRQAMLMVCTWLLLPSLAPAPTSGRIATVIHQPLLHQD